MSKNLIPNQIGAEMCIFVPGAKTFVVGYTLEIALCLIILYIILHRILSLNWLHHSFLSTNSWCGVDVLVHYGYGCIIQVDVTHWWWITGMSVCMCVSACLCVFVFVRVSMAMHACLY